MWHVLVGFMSLQGELVKDMQQHLLRSTCNCACAWSCPFGLQGHTVFDLADKDMLKILEELKKKQVTVSGYCPTTFCFSCEWHLHGNGGVVHGTLWADGYIVFFPVDLFAYILKCYVSDMWWVCGQPWRSTTSAPTLSESSNTSMIRPPVQSSSTAA